MAGSLFGLGAGTPSRFPYPDRPQPGAGVAPSSGAVFRGRLVIVFGPSGTVSGVFVYAPGTTPGPGNTPIAAMTASATDPFGNDVTPGDASALGTIIAIGSKPAGGTNSFVQLVPGNPAAMQIGSGDAAEVTPAKLTSGIFGAPAANRFIQTILSDAKVSGENAAAGIEIVLESDAVDHSFPPDLRIEVAQSSTVASGSTWTPTAITFRGTISGVMTDILTVHADTGAVTATQGTAANPTVITTDTWHSLGTLAGYTVNSARYRLTPNNEVEFDINVTGTGANATSVTFSVTLPAAYRPASLSHTNPLATNLTIAAMTTMPRVGITTAGAVSIAGTANIASTISYVGTFTMPLD